MSIRSFFLFSVEFVQVSDSSEFCQIGSKITSFISFIECYFRTGVGIDSETANNILLER